MAKRVALVGSTGFVGTAVREALDRRGCEIVAVSAPRLRADERTAHELIALARTLAAEVDLAGCDVVVNAAGDPDASSLDHDALIGANGLLPAVLLLAAAAGGARRFVHVSSAVVQNDVAVLDESEDLRPFSAYSASKVLGEETVRALAPETGIEVVRYRPPSVHAAGRRVTRMIARIASSPAASVARPGTQATPQALLPNVGDAVAFLATTEQTPPPVVVHPWEGVSVAGLMRDLSGGREPRRLPRSMARAGVAAAKQAGRLHRPTAANARRVELLWMGQVQAESWLTSAGWRPVVGPEGWVALGRASREGTS